MDESVFLCHRVDGQRPFELVDMRGFYAAVRRFGLGEDFEIAVREVPRQRTSKQNRFFHGPLLRAFSEHTGYRPEEIKAELCLRFIPREVHRLDGSVMTVPGHTSELTVKEFKDFLEQCIQLAAEMDIQIADSDQWRAA